MAKRKQKLTKNEKLGDRIAKACTAIEDVRQVLYKKCDKLADKQRDKVVDAELDKLETLYSTAANLLSSANKILDSALDILGVATEVK